MEQVFEPDVRHAARRPVVPARDVLVDLSKLWPPSRVRWGSDTPLWARAQGIQVSEVVPARLREWVITSCGDWYARCECGS
jgi:hypothetical protein